jgi:hypothetical protein
MPWLGLLIAGLVLAAAGFVGLINQIDFVGSTACLIIGIAFVAMTPRYVSAARQIREQTRQLLKTDYNARALDTRRGRFAATARWLYISAFVLVALGAATTQYLGALSYWLAGTGFFVDHLSGG